MEVQNLSRSLITGFAALCGLCTISVAVTAQTAPTSIRLSGHIPPLAARANLVGRVHANESISLALTLPLRSEPELDALIERAGMASA